MNGASKKRSLADMLALPADEAEIGFEPVRIDLQFKPVQPLPVKQESTQMSQ